MTDNRTTELLRLLDERGIEYETYRDVKNRNVTKWSTHHGAFVFFAVEQEGKLLVETTAATEHSAVCTPEQAIAATLGGDRESELQSALNKAAGNWAKADALLREQMSGTLTAEQVRDAVERHWHDLPAEYDIPEAAALPEYSYDWQAIADELNATIDGDECEWVLREKWPNRTGDDHVYGYETSCGVRHTWWPDSLPNYCPNCGREVVKR